MQDFTVSVIIPSYNRCRTLARAIDSLLMQTQAADEIILIDDGSNDGTKKFIQTNYPTIHYYYQENHGVSAARNKGIQLATGNWLCLLDSDDSWAPTKLEKQIRALSQQTDKKICHTNETWYRNGNVLNQGKKHKKRGGMIFQHCLPLCAISPSSVMIHRSLFHELGMFDESLPACEDYDMWLRVCSRYPVLYLDQALTNKYGGHTDQLSRQHWGMDRFRIIALNKIIQSGSLKQVDHELAMQMLLEKIRIFLKGAKKHGSNDYCEQFESLLAQHTHSELAVS